MTDKLTLVVFACLLGAPAVARGQTAEEIVAANITASGGEAAIARIQNFTSKARASFLQVILTPLHG